jgi:hypothetical protein
MVGYLSRAERMKNESPPKKCTLKPQSRHEMKSINLTFKIMSYKLLIQQFSMLLSLGLCKVL